MTENTQDVDAQVDEELFALELRAGDEATLTRDRLRDLRYRLTAAREDAERTATILVNGGPRPESIAFDWGFRVTMPDLARKAVPENTQDVGEDA